MLLPSIRLAFAFPFALTFAASTAFADGPSEAAADHLADSIVALRADGGAPALRRDARLDSVALAHAEDMAEYDYVGHDSPRTGTPLSRIGYVRIRATRVAENVVRAATPDEAIRLFAESAPHRAEILAGDVTDFGVAVVEDEEGFYVVEVFVAAVGAELAPPVSQTPDVSAARPIAPAPIESAPTPAPIEAAPDATIEADASLPEEECGCSLEDGCALPAYDDFVPESPAAIEPAPVAPYAAAPYAAAPYPTSVAAVPPTVVLQTQPPVGVTGYWVQAEGRWWFFPLTAGAGIGSVLRADPSVTGAPSGPTYPTAQRAYVSDGRVAPVSGSAPTVGYAPSPAPVPQPGYVAAPVSPMPRPRIVPAPRAVVHINPVPRARFGMRIVARVTRRY